MKYKNKICVVSSSRADYNHLYPLMDKLKESKNHTLRIIVTGMHLIKKHGYTYKEIESDGFLINEKIATKQINTTSTEILNSISNEIKGMTKSLIKIKPDVVLILGDRYDIFPVAIATHILQIPLAHIHGGEITSGVIDDGIRHAITKLANIHFVATNSFKKRVISMGENKKYVFNIGSLAVSGNRKIKRISKNKILNQLNINNKEKYFLITIHPETINESNRLLIKNILKAIKTFNNYFYIFTGTNSDTGADIINDHIVSFVNKNKDKARLIESSGRHMYVNLMRHASLVIGNSSSGIIEAPSLKTVSINIGNRQNGRPRSKSVFSSSYCVNDIQKVINKGLAFKTDNYKPIYKGSNSLNSILNILSNIDKNSLLNKNFFDK